MFFGCDCSNLRLCSSHVYVHGFNFLFLLWLFKLTSFFFCSDCSKLHLCSSYVNVQSYIFALLLWLLKVTSLYVCWDRSNLHLCSSVVVVQPYIFVPLLLSFKLTSLFFWCDCSKLHPCNCNTVHANNLQYLMIEIYQVLNSIGPYFMQGIFICAPISYNLRIKDRLQTPKASSVTYGLQSVSFRGSILWNKCPNIYKEQPSLQSFKQKIKEWKGSECNCRLCI